MIDPNTHIQIRIPIRIHIQISQQQTRMQIDGILWTSSSFQSFAFLETVNRLKLHQKRKKGK